MPYLQPKTNNYFGFQPVSVGGGESNFPVNAYYVSSSAPAIYAGDVLCFTSSGIPDTVISFQAGGATSTMPMVGVAAHGMPSGSGSTAATINSNSTRMLLVYDSPHQYFVGCDTTSYCISSTNPSGKRLGIETTGFTGSTGVNATLLRSIMTLSGQTASSGVYLFTLVGLHPVEQGVFSTVQGNAANSAVDVRKWIVKPNYHVYAQGVAGFAPVTS